MWRKHAVVALGHRQISLVAEVVALEIVDDIIDFMLEGITHFRIRIMIVIIKFSDPILF